MKGSTLCVVHLDKIPLRVVDKADGHEVTERFRVTNNLPVPQTQTEMLPLLAKSAVFLCKETPIAPVRLHLPRFQKSLQSLEIGVNLLFCLLAD